MTGIWSCFAKWLIAGTTWPPYLSKRFGLKNQASYVLSNGIGLINVAFSDLS